MMFHFICGAVIISFSPILVKLVQGIGPTSIGVYRCLFATIALFPLFLYQMKKGHGCRKWGIEVFYLFIASFSFSLDLYCWNRSILYSGAGMSTVLGNTQAIYLALIGILISKEKVTTSFLFSLPLALIGIILIAKFDGGIENVQNLFYLRGVVYGLLTGVFYAGYVFFLRKATLVSDNFSSLQQMFFISLFTAFFLINYSLFENGLDQKFPTGENLFYLLCSGIVTHSIGWILITKALPHVPISLSGLVLLIQPVLSTMWGMIILKEWPTGSQILGGITLLGAIYLGSGSGRYLLIFLRRFFLVSK